MMKICWVLPDIGNYHHGRMQALGKSADIEAHLVEFVDKSEYSEFKNNSQDELEYKRHTIFPGKAYTSLTPAEMASGVAGVLAKINPDLVCINGWGDKGALHTLHWCIGRSKPTVTMSATSGKDFRRIWWKEAVKSRVVNSLDGALVGGLPHLEYLQKLGLAPNRTLPGYDVVDNEHFKLGSIQARLQAEELRAKHGLPEKYFVCSNRFIEKKNLPRLLDAYTQYLQIRGENAWDLVMLGDGALRPVLEDKIREHGLSEHVHMLGFKPYHELPIYYGLASAFVHASTSEQWGLVVNEAMASGLPVILSNACGCAQDLVEEGRNGFTFDPYDVNKLANLLLHISSEDCDREAMGRASQKIISHWSPELFANNLKALAEMVLAAPRPNTGILDKLLLKALIHR